MNEKETRYYKFRGSKKDLETLEKLFRHMEYLGNIGASRNLLVRVDGDGFGQIQVQKIIELGFSNIKCCPIDNEYYNTKQDKLYSTSGVYDIG